MNRLVPCVVLAGVFALLFAGCGIKKQIRQIQETRFEGAWDIVELSFVGENGKRRILKIGEIFGDKTELKAPTMDFDIVENRIYGVAGCNNYFATFFYNKPRIKFVSSGATRRLCEESSMGFEFNFLRLLEGEFELQTSGKNLELRRLDSNSSAVILLEKAAR